MDNEESKEKDKANDNEIQTLKNQLSEANSKISRLETELNQALDLANKAKPTEEESEFDKIFRKEIL